MAPARASFRPSRFWCNYDKTTLKLRRTAFFYCLPFLRFARLHVRSPWTTGGTHWVRCVKIVSPPHVVLLVGILVMGTCVLVLTTGRMNLSLGGRPRQVSPSSCTPEGCFYVCCLCLAIRS